MACYALNVFALVKQFTFRPHPYEASLPNPLPFLPGEISYGAGVIMRNACRKDDTGSTVCQT